MSDRPTDDEGMDPSERDESGDAAENGGNGENSDGNVESGGAEGAEGGRRGSKSGRGGRKTGGVVPAASRTGVERTVPVQAVAEDFGNIRLGTGDISTLAESIKDRGLLQFPTVRPHPDYVAEVTRILSEAEKSRERAGQKLTKARERAEDTASRAAAKVNEAPKGKPREKAEKAAGEATARAATALEALEAHEALLRVPIISDVAGEDADRDKARWGPLTLAPPPELEPFTAESLPEPRYQLVSGFRRMQAVRFLAWSQVRVNVRADLNDADVRLAQLAENMERKELSPIENALGMKRMVEEDKKTRSIVADQLGIGRSEVTKHMNLLRLDREVQMMVHRKELQRTHADVIYRKLKDSPGAQREFAKRTVKEKLDVSTLDAYIRETLETKDAPVAEIEEQRVLALPPTPTSILSFREGVLPPEGLESEATSEQQVLMSRMLLYAALANFYDHEMRTGELGLPVPYDVEDVQEIMDYAEELEPEDVWATLFRLARRYFEAGHRATRIPPDFIARHMDVASSDESVQRMLDEWLASRDAKAESEEGVAEDPEGEGNVPEGDGNSPKDLMDDDDNPDDPDDPNSDGGRPPSE